MTAYVPASSDGVGGVSPRSVRRIVGFDPSAGSAAGSALTKTPMEPTKL